MQTKGATGRQRQRETGPEHGQTHFPTNRGTTADSHDRTTVGAHQETSRLLHIQNIDACGRAAPHLDQAATDPPPAGEMLYLRGRYRPTIRPSLRPAIAPSQKIQLREGNIRDHGPIRYQIAETLGGIAIRAQEDDYWSQTTSTLGRASSGLHHRLHSS
jgi:hypothetical protein